MGDTISTELGKIYCKYDEKNDRYDIKRVVKLNRDIKTLTICDCDEEYNLTRETKQYNEEEYSELRRNWIELKSDGIITKSNVMVIDKDEFSNTVNDVILMFFPNNQVTGVPSTDEFKVVARQAINNIYADMAGNHDVVGVSININNIPAGFALSDFIENKKIYNTTLTHFYKIDNYKTVARLLDNPETKSILGNLYNQRIIYLKNTDPAYKAPRKKIKDDCIDGYCNSLKRFLLETGFINDIKDILGIMKVDFEIHENTPLKDNDKILLSVLYGGIKIEKTFPLKFDYYIDLDSIKMKYLMVEDSTNTLFVIGYTEYADDVDVTELYSNMQERLDAIYGRLGKIVASFTT